MRDSPDFRADLHCHSTCSDGSLSPLELLQAASAIGLRGLSITDHDTIGAYDVAVEEAQRLGISLISGVEVSADHRGASVHILGYAFHLGDSPVKQLCERQRVWRLERNAAILSLLAKEGMPLSDEDLILPGSLQKTESPGRPHIALAMIAKGYVSSLEEAFRRYIGDGCPCYYGGNKPGVEETIATIRAAGGVAILAHPHLINDPALVKDLLKMPFDGLEGYYASLPRWQEERWLRAAKEKGWIVTGGSDFHGAHRPRVPLGASWVPEATFLMLLQRFNAGAALS